MSIFSHIKRTNTVFKHARMLSASLTSASGGWGRTSKNSDDDIMHNYSIYINFGHLMPGVSCDDSVKDIFVKVVKEPSKTKKEYVQTIAKTRLTRSVLTKEDEINNIKDARVCHYTYS